MTNINALTVKGLCVAFQRWGQTVPAVTQLDLNVPQGQWLMVIGHNGSGKSSLLKAIAGHIDVAPEAVNFWEFRHSIINIEFSSDIFYVAQDPLTGTADALTLVENFVVADPDPNGRADGKTDRNAYYDELLAVFDLLPRKNQLLKYFSGGERQLIALTIARLRRPALLLLDEPFSALDPQRTTACLELLQTMHSTGTTILQITHDLKIASTYGDRTISLNKGALELDVSGDDRLLRFKEKEGLYD